MASLEELWPPFALRMRAGTSSSGWCATRTSLNWPSSRSRASTHAEQMPFLKPWTDGAAGGDDAGG